MGWKDVTPSDSVEAADWIAPRLHPFAQDVGSVVPTGFAGYARIFHPARGWGPAGGEVRWSEVAATSGRMVHPEMQFHAIAAPVPGRPIAPPRWSDTPRDGTLSAGQLSALMEILPHYTATPNACCMCLWEGYGYNTAVWLTAESRTDRDQVPPPDIDPVFLDRVSGPPRFAELLKKAKRVRLPARDYLLFKGSIDQAEGWGDGPNLWWPEDRAWCVASEIDFAYTYIGGSRALIAAILRHPALEALPATPDQGITYDSDSVNS